MSTPKETTMDKAMTLHDLLAEVEGAKGPSRELDGKLAQVLLGWQRFTPSQLRRKHPGWIHPDDYLGRHSDGSPRLDGMHGTTIHKHPPNLTASLDVCAALQERVLPGWKRRVSQCSETFMIGIYGGELAGWPTGGEAEHASEPLAWLAAIIRALIAQQEMKEQSND